MITEQPRAFLQHRRQKITDLALFLVFSIWVSVQLYTIWTEGRLDFIEISFGVHNVVFAFLFLIRTKHTLFNENILDQGVAAIAFLSGAAFIGQPATAAGSALVIARSVIVASNVVSIATMLNLGRSFGVFIAFREIRTTGLYGLVRHPMYLADILLRVGYLVSHFTPFIVGAFVLSSGCYVYRAILEERFLVNRPEYVEYLKKVKYRFIPYVY